MCGKETKRKSPRKCLKYVKIKYNVDLVTQRANITGSFAKTPAFVAKSGKEW